MAKKTAPLLPGTDELLRRFGDRLRLARRRRRLAAKQVAERAGMVPMTLRSLERGGAGVTIGAYLAVMQVLGIEKDLDFLGKADLVGRDLQDAELSRRTGISRASLTASEKNLRISVRPVQADAATAEPRPAKRASKEAPASTKQDKFVSADALVGLLDAAVARKRNSR